MLPTTKAGTAASLVEWAVLRGLDERAEFVHFELKQHFLVIRLRWGSRMRMLWRGLRVEVPELMAYLKTAAGMDASVCHVRQAGELAFVYRGQTLGLSAVCRPYMTEEKVVLSLLALPPEAEPSAA